MTHFEEVVLDGVALLVGVGMGLCAALVVYAVLCGVCAVLWRVLVAAVLVARFAWAHAFPEPPPPPLPPRCERHGWLNCPRSECRQS